MLIKIEHEQPKKRLFRKSPNKVELDTNIIVYDEHKQQIDLVNYSQRCSYDCAIMHIDSEMTSIDLSKITPEAKYIAIVVDSYEHYKFDNIPYIKFTMCSDDIVKSHEFTESFKGRNAILIGYFYRNNDEWKFLTKGYTYDSEDKSTENQIIKLLN